MPSAIVSYCDPEARQLLADKAAARELEWLAGEISEATFLRSLMVYGKSLEEAKHELWKLQQEL